MKSRSNLIPTICGRREFLNNRPRPKLAYYQNVNKLSQTRFNPHNLTYVECPERNIAPPSQSKLLKFCTCNAQSLRNKSESFVDYIVDNKIDLIARTETWFSESDDAVKVNCTTANYKLLDCPRLNRRGGGIAIIYRSEIQVTEVISGSKPTF